MRKIKILAALLVAVLALPACTRSETAQTTQKGEQEMKIEFTQVNNMAGVEGDDPYVIEHQGAYYYCWSEGAGIYVAELENMGAIVKDNGVLVYDRSKDDFYGIWAPELHYINGKWYIYAAMCQGRDENEKHRMYCLESDSPLGQFVLKGQVTDSTDRWAIDGTVFTYKDELYTIWSGWPGAVDEVQNLYIAHMSNPWTIDSERVMISTPDSWDGATKNPRVNEGPCVVSSGDQIFCLFSGNGSWTDIYSVGYLVFDGADPMDPNAWSKSEKPILKRVKGFFGPGHCSVTRAVDGSSWIIYHANLEAGTGWYGRSVRIQALTFTDGGIAPITQEETVQIPVLSKP